MAPITRRNEHETRLFKLITYINIDKSDVNM